MPRGRMPSERGKRTSQLANQEERRRAVTRYTHSAGHVLAGRLPRGGLAERSKAHAWKACRGVTSSRVRTPQPPPERWRGRKWRRGGRADRLIPDRARWGASGALYPQSAPAGLNPCPRARTSRSAPALEMSRVRSRATPTCEPRQVREEAALSRRWRVPRGFRARVSVPAGALGVDVRRQVHGPPTCRRVPPRGPGRVIRVM